MRRVIGTVLLVGFPWLCVAASAQTLPTQADTTAPATPQEFVQLTFIHGVPYDRARALGPGAVPVLTKMLQESMQRPDSAEGPTLANIAVTLGILGDPASVDLLIDFVQRGSGQLSREAYAARTSAVMALGYLVNVSSDARALKYLQDSADPQAWDRRSVAWGSPFGQSPADRNQQLAEVAVLGLALTGKPEAAATLRQLAARKDAGPSGDRVAQVASDALKEHEIVARDGLSAYYKRRLEIPGRRR